MISRVFALIAISALVASCAEGENTEYSMSNFDNIPKYITGDREYNEALSRQAFVRDLKIARSLPIVERLSCGPFDIDLTASQVANGNDYRVRYEGGSGEYSGFAITIKAPPQFSDRVRFKELVYPDGNSRIYYREVDGSWRDVTNPERTYTPEAGPDTYYDRYFGFDPSRNEFAFIDGRIAMITAWDMFVTRTITHPDSGPKGRYRISFTTDYEMEWDGGSCRFRLPDMEFSYR